MENKCLGMDEMLKDMNVLIVTHVYATGPAQELENYLKCKVSNLVFIGHPFSYSKDIRSFYKCHSSNNAITFKKSDFWNLPEPLIYFKDIYYTFVWTFHSKMIFDLYVGADPLNAVTGLLLKRLHKVNKVIFYTVDYVPKRFHNPLLNWFYHFIDSYCTRHCDYVWNLSQRMTEARKGKGILKTGNQIVVPIGVHFDRIKRLPIEEIERKNLVYMGHLRRGQGLELIIDAMPDLLRKVPELKLIIIGTGPLENFLKERIRQLNLFSNVDFVGFVDDHKDLEKIMTRCAVGLALYEPNPDNFTWYSDPSKPKQYMACGLPVIITGVPWIGEEVRRKKMGILINFNKEEFISAVCKLVYDDNFFKSCKNNATNYAEELDWSIVFRDPMEVIICGR